MMASENISILENVLTHDQPLGPIDQARIIGDDAARSLLDEEVTPFRNVSHNPHMLLLGRKGSGKSAILTEIRLKLIQNPRYPQIPEHLPRKGEPYIIPVLSWQHFHQITRNVATQFPEDELWADMIPPEAYVKLWQEMLWDEILQHFFNYWHLSEVQGALLPVRDYINADKPFQGSAEQEAKRLFHRAQRSVLDFLKQRRSQLYFLFDSMENYPVRNTIFSRVLVGLFQALSAVDAESPNVQISFCIPEELEDFLTSSSANLLKDFASSYRIRWRPIDLLRIVAHRFRLAMAIHDEEFYFEIEDHNFSNRDDIHQLFSRILPKHMNNALGDPEDPLAYIIRHTQLLPRHVLAIFNAILSRNYRSTGGFRRVEESAIRDGVTHVQEIIAMQILDPYMRLYPRLITACRELLPDLNPISSFSDLAKLERRFKHNIEEDIGSVWGKLFQMGVLGRAVEPVRGGDSHSGQSDRYRYGQFHFNIDGAFGMATHGEYCFHPVFSRAFGMSRREDDRRVVYPANIDLITLT
jgi:hypothetical protein